MGGLNFNFYLLGEAGKKLSVNKLLLLFIFTLSIALNESLIFSQETIPSSGGTASPCGNCTPNGWFDNGGTPDISNRNIAGGNGSLGGGDSWTAAPLPLPPTGDLTWITMRDIGDYNASPLESVRTTMGGLIAGNVYILNMYINTSISNGDGGDYYSGQYIDRFLYQIYKDGDTPIDQTVTVTSDAHDKWTRISVIFIGDPNGSGEMNLALSPDDNAVTGGDDANLESIHIAVELNDLSKLDTDGDGVPDKDDIDDDNDGILDTVETNIGGTQYAPLGDEDGDGVPNYLDVRDEDPGSSPTDTDYTDANGDGVADIFDFDDDGIPNHLDLDTDNDGIPDNIEAQTTAGYIAPNADTQATYISNNGLNSAYVGQSFTTTPANTDGTDEADYRDLNSDNDATNDDIEANLILSGTVGENGLDNSYDNGDDYTDVNGIFDNTQSDNFPDTGPGNDVNWRDTGIDGTLDTDGDGVPNTIDLDDDNDGILDTVETTTDTDGDGIPNYLDLDSDGDGIPDIIEAQPTFFYIAPNADSPATYTTNQGVNSAFLGGISVVNTNSGSDSVPDYLDLDSDGDGYSDRVEANLSLVGNNGINGLDNNYDNGDDYTDVNGSFDNIQADNFPDTTPGGDVDWRDATTLYSDNDNDGIVDSNDLDDDNDGIFDAVETAACSGGLSYQFFNSVPSGNTVANIPTTGEDASGIATNFDVNSLANTLSGDTETYSFRFYGTINIATADTYTFYLNSDDGSRLYIDGEQIVDYDGLHGANGPVSNSVALTSGVHDIEILFFENTGGDSLDVEYSSASITQQDIPFSILSSFCDTDGDGIPDHRDLDADNDGIPDNIEAQTTAGYAIPNGVYDSNGVDTAYSSGLTPEDTDNDSTPDYRDNDSDDDGLLDNTEAGLVLTGIYGNNGLDNAYDNGDNFVDVNGSFDNSQTDNFPDADGDVFNAGDVDYRDDTFTVDTDGDGVNDEIDLDDDDDGILDSVEIGSCTVGGANFVWGTEFSTNDDPTLVNNPLTIDDVEITITRTSNVGSGSTYEVNSDTQANTYNLLQGATQTAVSRQIFSFDTPVYGLGFTLYDLDEDTGSATDHVQIIITKQDGTNYTMVAGVDYTVPGGITDLTNNTFEGNNGNDGSDLTISSIPEYITKLQIVYSNSGTGSLTGTQVMAIGDMAFCTPVDTDGDGVFDFRDLDADNDGIPDNIEAQSTQNYIAPTGNHSIFGIDLAYGNGLTAVNTDESAPSGSDTIPDFLDSDSDGDGTNDVLEALDSPLANDGTMVTGTVGANGLIDDVETGDTDQGYTPILTESM